MPSKLLWENQTISTNVGLCCSESLLQEIRTVARTATHVAPHYHVVSKSVDVGAISPIVNYLRAMLIESVYRHLVTMFPETANWLMSADEIIHVGINAVI